MIEFLTSVSPNQARTIQFASSVLLLAVSVWILLKAAFAKNGATNNRVLLLLTLLFFVGSYHLMLTQSRKFVTDLPVPAELFYMILPFAFVLYVIIVFAYIRKNKGNDLVFLIAVLLLSVSLVVITYLAPYLTSVRVRGLAYKHAVTTLSCVITAAAVIAMLKNKVFFRALRRRTYIYLALGILLLLLTWVFGPEINGRRLWIRIGSLSIQSIDIVKILYALFISGYLAKYSDMLSMLANIKMSFFEYLRFAAPVLTAMCLICAVLFLMDDLGQILCVFLLTFVILIYAGIRPDFATAIFAFIVFALWGFYELGNTDLLTGMPSIVASALEKYHQRIDGFIHPYANSFQNAAALWEMAAAGWTGSGPMLSQPSRIPYSYAEMMFASSTAYYGMAGGTAIILSFLALMIASWKVSQKASDPYLEVLTFASGTMLTIEAFYMAASAMSLCPVSGMTLGFLSAGGTAMIKNGVTLSFIIYTSLAGEEKND